MTRKSGIEIRRMVDGFRSRMPEYPSKGLPAFFFVMMNR
jgi:hypothetical protein